MPHCLRVKTMQRGGETNGSEAAKQGGRAFAALSKMRASHARREVVGYVIAVLGVVLLTVALLPVRDSITPLSKGFGYLVVVAVAAAVGGLWPGLTASLLGFVTFNFFFLPPYSTFTIARPEHVVVLFVFLGLAVLISALLARATDRARVAEQRQGELEMLQELSARLVALRPGPDGYASVIVGLLYVFDLSAGSLWVHDPQTRELHEETTVGADPGELKPRSDLALDDHPPERLPLSVGGRNLGLLVLRGDRPPFTPEESRVLRAFCDQFALVLERDRLLREATKSQVYAQADEVRRSLLAAVSHDLRTPIAAIKTSVTDLLADDSPQSGEYLRDALESIDGETDRLANLVANLLDMSRIELGMLQARLQGVDLTETLQAAVDRAKMQHPTLDLRLAIEQGSAVVRADPVFLERVLSNLLDNATKASLEHGSPRIEVAVRRIGDSAVVRVIDHGKGIPWSVREQLFYPFYQMSERHPRLGTGLGLPISKGFLALMSGEIWVEDTPGGGATFAFSVPLEGQDAPAPRPIAAGTAS
jgi:two-component system sensor histidine kinase KdpD